MSFRARLMEPVFGRKRGDIQNWCKSSLVSYFSSLSHVLLSMGKQITLLNRRITEGLSFSSASNQMHPDARPSWVLHFIVPVTGTKNESPAVTSTDDEVETGMTGQHYKDWEGKKMQSLHSHKDSPSLCPEKGGRGEQNERRRQTSQELRHHLFHLFLSNWHHTRKRKRYSLFRKETKIMSLTWNRLIHCCLMQDSLFPWKIFLPPKSILTPMFDERRDGRREEDGLKRFLSQSYIYTDLCLAFNQHKAGH